MAVNTYKNIPDFIAYQVLLYADLNTLQENMRYFQDDLFGDPSTNSDHIKSIGLGNTNVDGGSIYFDKGTAKYMRCDNSEMFECVGFGLKMQSPQVIKGGDRVAFNAHTKYNIGPLSSAAYLIDGHASSEAGFCMPRAGSLVYAIARWKVATYTSSGQAQVTLKKNGVDLYSIVSVPLTSVGYDTYSYVDPMIPKAGYYDFAAGDYISPYYSVISGTYTVWVSCNFTVIFN